MHCPTCNSNDISFLSEVSWGIPWEPYTGAEGETHIHDPNKHFKDYKCKNGHVFEETFFPACKNCGWQKENQ